MLQGSHSYTPMQEPGHRNALSLYQHEHQHKLQQQHFQEQSVLQRQQIFQQQARHLRDQELLQLPQHLAKEHAAFTPYCLVDTGVAPALPYATFAGPGVRPGAIDRTSVAQLKPAMSTPSPFNDGNQQTLALSELLPR
jgi:hypothetical protein